MMKVSLVIMAAGLGSRYGGNKQMDGIGPNGEFLMEYAVYDAVRAGFNKIVFIIKPGMEELMHRLCGQRLTQLRARDGSLLEVHYAYQDFSSLPEWFSLPENRVKPYGTVHALLCAADIVQEPCCVINADDYYGAGAYRTIYDHLVQLPKGGKALLLGYHLKNTTSLHGTVSRGICQMEAGTLRGVKETKNIQMYPDGTLEDVENHVRLDPDSVVSMNFWGYAPSMFPMMRIYFEQFLRDHGQEERTECLLPIMVDDMVRDGALEVEVLHSTDRWFGMTYQEDRPLVASELRKLHEAGQYPASLRDRTF